MNRVAVLGAVMLMPVLAAIAQDTTAVMRPTHRVIDVSVGTAAVLDTYLSPITYEGIDLGLHLDHYQATGFAPERWVRRLEAGIDYARVHNPARTGNIMHAVDITARWSLARRWHVKATQLAIGPMTDLAIGAVYNPAGSNNVVSAKARWSIGATASASWHTLLCHRPLTLHGALSLPMLGVWFAPDGYESYYEIYLGNRRHLAHMAWWGNRFDMNACLAADWQLGGTTLRLIYRNRYERSTARGLKSRCWSNTVGIGIGGDFVTLSPRRPLSRYARTVHATR